MFCRNCGKELCEQAFVCPGCGCLVGEQRGKASGEKLSASNEKLLEVKKDKTLKSIKLSLIISVAFLALALMFSIWGLIKPYMYLNIYSIYRGYDGYVRQYMEIHWVICTCIATAAAVGTGITAFVLSFQKKQEETLRLITLLNLIFCVAMTGICIFMCCFVW